MLIRSLAIPKRELTVVKESATLQEAIEILEDSGYRCVPILDETGTLFRGNIYKMHIYRHKANGGDMNLPVTHLLKNATKFISLDSSFFKVFFTIKELPYIAVLNKDMTFFGIMTHSSLLNMLAQSWSVDAGSYVLTILAPGEKGDLFQITKIINKYSSIASVISLDVTREEILRRVLVTLPAGISKSELETIVNALDKQDYKVVSTENLQAD
ncbi:cyclic di-AMP binding protein CbpA [Jeotgalibaca sp. MA1X17-3]|uniref:cyclic di-AMP binding protein CbpA n=1 Tax=Jeotgalibaca sp. MA1X17-3 TaxID=2908211 RepID=UPI001F1EF19C|nr:cyclic di-AMP binding protein CbpA [Jeotgalibaca sp. MA1X17-3]UJF15941.1 cyclic di-AMP binding protein CbpA [Jeotgalibaca sp. MA1X17-3]